MKKIALTIAAFAVLGLTACGGDEPAATNDTLTDMNVTDEALGDLNAADVAADSALDNASNSLDNAADAVDNAADNASNAM